MVADFTGDARAIGANFVADDLVTAQSSDSAPPSVHVVHQFIRKSMGDAWLRYVIPKVKGGHASALGWL